MEEQEMFVEEGDPNEAPPEKPGEDIVAVKSDAETALEILLGVETEQTTGVRTEAKAKAQTVTLADRARAFRARIDALEAEMEVRNENK